MIRAILFDMGGTLDGDGQHWLDRFVGLYRQAGVDLPRDTLRAAFDAAEVRAAADDAIATAGIDAMVARHVGWQLRYLKIDDVPLRDGLIAGFIQTIRTAVVRNRPLLADLFERGLRLGVVSNGCGNVELLCRDYGYLPYLGVVIDSRRAGLSKPDPGIFERGAARLGVLPRETLVVGDSFERDIVPARRAGMMTAWLQPDASTAAPDTTMVDVRLARLADLTAALDLPHAVAASGRASS